jgi:hypothetical protein
MMIDPRDALTWTVLSQTTRRERRMLALLGWLDELLRRRPVVRS